MDQYEGLRSLVEGDLLHAGWVGGGGKKGAWIVAPVPVKNRELVVNGVTPMGMVILDSGAAKPMISSRMARRMGITDEQLTVGVSFVTAIGKMSTGQRMTREKLSFTLAAKTQYETTYEEVAFVVDTDCYDVLLGIEVIGPIGGVYESWVDVFTWRVDYHCESRRKVDSSLLVSTIHNTQHKNRVVQYG